MAAVLCKALWKPCELLGKGCDAACSGCGRACNACAKCTDKYCGEACACVGRGCAAGCALVGSMFEKPMSTFVFFAFCTNLPPLVMGLMGAVPALGKGCYSTSVDTWLLVQSVLNLANISLAFYMLAK